MRRCALNVVVVLLVVVLAVACKRVSSDAGPPTPERLAKACIAYVACDPFAGTVDGCIRSSAFLDSSVSVYRPDQIRCLADIRSGCDAVLACVGVSISTCSEPMTACDGDTLVTCSAGRRYTVDCADAPRSLDGTCIRDTCGYEACADVTMSRCNGTRLEHCDLDGVLTGVDCTLYGEVCVDDGRFARCEPAQSVPCSFTYCDGKSSLIECASTGHRIDCASLYSGGICLVRSLRCGYDDECSPEEPAFCIGDAVEACVLGRWVPLDCRELGFAGCVDGRCVR